MGSGTPAFGHVVVLFTPSQDEVLPDGTRVVQKGSRQAPGRVTVLSDSGEVLMDDYVEVSEVIVDYLTRWALPRVEIWQTMALCFGS